jgi:GNAT superfamily N-acetyltransferase
MSDSTPGLHRFLVREATAHDLPYIRAWLPDALGGTPRATIGMATEAATGAVAGSAALRIFADRVGRFLLFVNPAFRRRGCGTVLLESVRQAARRANVRRLLTGRSYPAEAADAESASAVAFFQARGLSVGQDILGYRAELKAALAVLEPLYQRSVRELAHRHRARIVTADQVDRAALADFAVRHTGGYPEDIIDRLGGRRPAYSLATSLVALEDQRIVGALLTMTRGPNVFIETRAVAPEHRGGWINLALMHRAAAAAARLGVTTIEFECEAEDHDTTKLARRLGARQVARRQCWSCPLPASAGPPPASGVHPLDGAAGMVSAALSGWQAEALGDQRMDGLELPQLQEWLFFDSANGVIQMPGERSVEGLPGSIWITSALSQ